MKAALSFLLLFFFLSTFAQNGNVGIGITDPANRLHLHDPDVTIVPPFNIPIADENFLQITNWFTGEDSLSGLRAGVTTFGLGLIEHPNNLTISSGNAQLRVISSGDINMESRVGIGTTNPLGILDLTSADQALVVPRVPGVEGVTNGDGGPPVDGSIVYDTNRKSMMFRVDGKWITYSFSNLMNGQVVCEDGIESQGSYIKASNTDEFDEFGFAVAISADGNTMAVGARFESSASLGINGNQADNSMPSAGAVYVFMRSGNTWIQEAYIKADFPSAGAMFGHSVSLSDDGNYLAVGAPLGTITIVPMETPGVVYVFHRSGSTWSQQFFDAPLLDAQNGFSLDISGDGSTLAVGVPKNDVQSPFPPFLPVTDAGSASIYVRSGSTWSPEFQVTAPLLDIGDQFGFAVSISQDGNTLAVGAPFEDTDQDEVVNGGTIINNTSASASGSVYIYERSGGVWSYTSMIKPTLNDQNDLFGVSLSLSGDGSSLAVGSAGEQSSSKGINGNSADNSFSNSGAVYIFTNSNSNWAQTTYIKAPNNNSGDQFSRVSISDDGNTLAVGAIFESSNASGINGDQIDNSLSSAGAVYLYQKVGNSWLPHHYVKASNPDSGDFFGNASALSGDGSILAVAGSEEDSNATGINGDQSDNSASHAGAVYVFE